MGLELNQLAAIIGHEIGHIKYGDSLFKLLYYALSGSVPVIAYHADNISVKINNFLTLSTRNIWVSLIGSIFILTIRVQNLFVKLGMWIIEFIYKYAMKLNEYAADHIGAVATSKEVMSEVLSIIKSLEDKSPQNKNPFYQLLAEHPKTESRIKYIQNI